MFRIPKIENSQYYIDSAIKSMQDFAVNDKEAITKRYRKSDSTKSKTREEVLLNKRKDLELNKIRHMNSKVNEQLKKVVKWFPNFKKVEEIYKQLINASPNKVGDIEKAVSKVKWIASEIDELTQRSEFKIKKARTSETIGFIMKKYIGKSNSYFKKNNSSFLILTESSQYLNSLPTFKDLYTVSIAGFPNVGKSTLMKKITGCDVEIQNYPFTTKGLMFGYLSSNETKTIQLIDTPGLLGREKENLIEQKAQVIIQEYCNEIIFVIDFTKTCGYDIENQLKLLKNTAKSEKPIVIYLSKSDIFDEQTEIDLEDFGTKLKKYKVFTKSDEIKEYILKNYLKSLKKFDPKQIRTIR